MREGWWDFIGGLELGARNMTAVGIATATAGIMVGTVTLTGIGLVMTEIVEFLSQGNIVIMLVLVGVICIILGTGLPTTASYVVVATLMAPVVVELAAENDLAVPLIAVHMFVFYFGLMADVSPPVGLAAYAAAAIAGADPMRVGWQGTWYEFRTVLLPFIFIFNPEILLIDIGGPWHFIVVVGCATLAMMAFVAALQGYFFARNRWWETALLLLICFTLFRPNFWMDRIVPPYRALPASEVVSVIEQTKGAGALRLRVATVDMSGDDTVKTIRLTLGDEGDARAAPGGSRHRACAGRPADHRLRAARVRSGAPEAAPRRQDRGRQRPQRAPEPLPVRHSRHRPAAGPRPAAAAPADCLPWRDAVIRQPRFPPSMSGVAGPAMLSRRQPDAAGISHHGSSSMRTLLVLLLAQVISSAGTVAVIAQERPAAPPAGAPGVVTEGSGNVVDRRSAGRPQGRQDGRRRGHRRGLVQRLHQRQARPRPWATGPAAAASPWAAAVACSSTASPRPAPAT